MVVVVVGTEPRDLPPQEQVVRHMDNQHFNPYIWDRVGVGVGVVLEEEEEAPGVVTAVETVLKNLLGVGGEEAEEAVLLAAPEAGLSICQHKHCKIIV